ncbi:hypothetical protein QWZ14_04920 [Paeniroseomonas aquatica]|uniref:Uncharacterized protein n=2 Tax=Paeniroseomonas aquatica TaxID=373043 RepID=A0ABT8A1U3_9PROT|nr:hypothetical protein [Paeniroseomonas aquatica]MDN3563717.1 hypothetical protein [Paeniroseomonas aquatica]
MSPYVTIALEVVTTLASSLERRDILRGWLNHRASLRAIGFARGFQWLDGSFVEDKQPRDLDVVSFLYRPHGIRDPQQLLMLIRANGALFVRNIVKAQYRLDAFPVDLDGSPEALVSSARYFLGLFSHRRGDDLWKGMLQVRMEDVADDAAALSRLGAAPAAAVGGQP